MGSAISEKVELLGKGCYTDIPDVLTIKSLPTVSELDYASGEDFDLTMLDKILPQAVEEKINFYDLLDIDYQWLLRCLRILNFGPYHTTNSIYCDKCNKTSYGEYSVDLRSISCIPLPDGFKNEVRISKDSFIDFKGDVTFRLPTIQQVMNCYKDKVFQMSNGKINRQLARMCYMITSLKGDKELTPVEIKLIIDKEFSPADYILLRDSINSLSDYGLRAGGTAQCPNCGNKEAAFIALVDDRYFRPSVGDLRRWRDSRNTRSDKDVSRNPPKAV